MAAERSEPAGGRGKWSVPRPARLPAAGISPAGRLPAAPGLPAAARLPPAGVPADRTARLPAAAGRLPPDRTTAGAGLPADRTPWLPSTPAVRRISAAAAAEEE